MPAEAQDPDAWLTHSAQDPDAWLEADTPAVSAWQADQNARTSEVLAQWPHLSRLRALTARLTPRRSTQLPVNAAGQWWRLDVVDERVHVVVSASPYGPAQPLYGPPGCRIGWFAPSPDGRLFCVGLAEGGSDRTRIVVVDAGTGKELADRPPQLIMDAFSGGAWWLPDGSGFFFTALEDVDTFVQQVYLHLLGEGTTQVRVPWITRNDYRLVRPSLDGRRVVAIERLLNPVPVAVADLDDPRRLVWRPLFPDTSALLAGHLVDHRFVGITDLDAPRGRLVAVDVNRPDPTQWTTLAVESPAALRRIDIVGDDVYLGELVDTYSRIRRFGLGGDPRGHVPLPELSAVTELPYPYMNLAHRPHQDAFLFSVSTFTQSAAVCRYDPATDRVNQLVPPEIVLHDVVVEDLVAESVDGTAVPYHVVRSAAVPTTAPAPALLHVYGALNAALPPQYPGTLAAFIASGGLYIDAHVRGGGEFGRAWWEGGRFDQKQNSYDDLYAVAEQLVRDGRTRPDRLALTGTSAGGVTSGVALTQRPGLWAAAVLVVPALDLLANLRDAYGRLVLEVEYLQPGIVDVAPVLLDRSPYHLLRERAYPPTLVIAAGLDPRCPALHARKFVARLQRCQRGGAPALLRVWAESDHHLGGTEAGAGDARLEQLAFVMAQLGVVPVTVDELPEA